MFKRRFRILADQRYVEKMNYKISPGKLTINWSDGEIEEMTTEKVRANDALFVIVDKKISEVDYVFKKGIVLEKTRAIVVVED